MILEGSTCIVWFNPEHGSYVSCVKQETDFCYVSMYSIIIWMFGAL